MERRGYYDRRFRGGVLSAVHHFSLNSENEDDLLRQVNVLRAGQEPSPSGAGAAQGAERPPPREEPLTESGRREVEYCPGLRQPLHHVQRGGTMPRLHRPPPRGESEA